MSINTFAARAVAASAGIGVAVAAGGLAGRAMLINDAVAQAGTEEEKIKAWGNLPAFMLMATPALIGASMVFGGGHAMAQITKRPGIAAPLAALGLGAFVGVALLQGIIHPETKIETTTVTTTRLKPWK